MQALRFHSTGELTALRVEEIPIPEPAAGEVLVRVEAAAINPSDVKNVLGKMHQTTLPRTPGRDFAGVVVTGAQRFLNRQVWGTGGDLGFTRDGTHAEYVVVPEEAVLLKPGKLISAQAAAMGVGYMTAWAGVMDAAGLGRGETILVLGVTGAVGSAAAQLARWRGARVLGVIRREADRDAAADLPVDVLINLEEGELPQAVFAATGGRGADVVLDVVGGAMFETCLQCLALRGRQIAITSTGGARVSFNLVDFYHREGRLLGVDTLKLSFAESGRILAALLPGVESGALQPPAVETYPLARAPEAYELIDSGKSPKKIVLVAD